MLAISSFDYNGSSYTFTWNGGELAKAVKGGVTTTYKYGEDGLRTEKKVGSTTYNYYYADGCLIRQTWGTNYMDFLYDESGSPYSFIYNGTQYYYVKNLQGDVMRIVNATGSVVANYYYDAWGKVTASGSIGQLNPIRYRGYKNLRIDGMNKSTKTIFELKPYNIPNARRAVKQILNYNKQLGNEYKMVIVFY